MSDYVAIGNDELKNNPDIKEGQVIIHTHEDGTEEESVVVYAEYDIRGHILSDPLLLGTYVLKDGRTFLAAVHGKLIPRENLRLKQ
jgi:hypothetical protein